MAIENVNQKPTAASAALADYLIASIGGKVRRVPINTLADILTDAEVGIINAAAEALISAAGKSSYIGTNENWFVWDGKKNAFVDSGKPSRGEKGDVGVIFTPYLSGDGILSWTNNGNLPNPKPVKLSGAGEVTAESIKEALGYTPIGEDDLPISSVNGQTGAVKTSWYFDVTGSVASPATTQTIAQIVAAQAAGFLPICKAALSEFDELPATLPALLVSSMMCVFGGIGTVNGTTSYISVIINAFGTLEVTTGDVASKSDIPKIPTSLKNPNALSIKIGKTTTSYDGSAAKTVKIPEGVPAVAAADNGKFLRVVSGAWAAAAIDNANGGSF